MGSRGYHGVYPRLRSYGVPLPLPGDPVDNPARLLTAAGNKTLDWLNVRRFGVYGDDLHDDTGAIQDLLNEAAPRPVYFPPGCICRITAPLTVPPYTTIIMAPSTTQVSETIAGACLRVDPSFSVGSQPVSAAILLLSQTAGGYGTVSEEQHFYSVMIDGSKGPANVHGIASYGQVKRVQMHNVLVSQHTGNGIHQQLDTGGNQPDAWTCEKVFCRFGTGIGFSLRSADSTWDRCLSTNTGSIGWFINTTSNSKYLGCRAEHAGTLGFGYVCTNAAQASGGVIFVGCSTDQSTQHGFQIGGTINGVANFAQSVPVLLSGCNLRRDGANGGSGGGSYAGLYVNGYPAVVLADGLEIFPGVNDDGSGTNSPQFAVAVLNSSNIVRIGGAYLHAATTILDTDNTNTDIFISNATGATGSTSAPSYTANYSYTGT